MVPNEMEGVSCDLWCLIHCLGTLLFCFTKSIIVVLLFPARILKKQTRPVFFFGDLYRHGVCESAEDFQGGGGI